MVVDRQSDINKIVHEWKLIIDINKVVHSNGSDLMHETTTRERT